MEHSSDLPNLGGRNKTRWGSLAMPSISRMKLLLSLKQKPGTRKDEKLLLLCKNLAVGGSDDVTVPSFSAKTGSAGGAAGSRSNSQ